MDKEKKIDQLIAQLPTEKQPLYEALLEEKQISSDGIIELLEITKAYKQLSKLSQHFTPEKLDKHIKELSEHIAAIDVRQEKTLKEANSKIKKVKNEIIDKINENLDNYEQKIQLNEKKINENNSEFETKFQNLRNKLSNQVELNEKKALELVKTVEQLTKIENKVDQLKKITTKNKGQINDFKESTNKDLESLQKATKKRPNFLEIRRGLENLPNDDKLDLKKLKNYDEFVELLKEKIIFSGTISNHVEGDARYYNITGDTLEGPMDVATNYIDISEIAAPGSPSENDLRIWSQDEAGFTVLHQQGSDGVDRGIGRDVWHVVRNETGSTISKGEAVYVSGSNGNYPTVGLAQADNVATMPVFGFAAHDINTNSFGIVYNVGDLIGFDLSGFTEGAIVYASTTVAGGIQETKPTGDDIAQVVGEVTKNTASGVLLITVQGSQIANENVNHTSVTLTAGDGLSGGGDISNSRTLDLDLNGLNTLTSIEAGDKIPFTDITDSSNKNLTFSNLESSLNLANLSGTVDVSDQTNLVAGSNLTLTDDTLSVDDAFLLNTGDTGTGEYNINVATATESALILKTTDDDTTNPCLKVVDSTDTTLLQVRSDGKLLAGDSYNNTRGDSGFGPRALTFIDSNSILRNWRFSTSDAQKSGLELIHGTNDNAASSANVWWNVETSGAGGKERFYISRRTGSGSPDNKFAIDDTGKAGVNTVDPAAKLHIVGDSDEEQLIIDMNSTNTTAPVKLRDSTGTVKLKMDNEGELYTKEDNFGVMNRLTHKGFTPDEFFRDSFNYLDGGWAGSPFGGTPSVVNFSTIPDHVTIGDSGSSGTTFFRYKNITYGDGVTNTVYLRVIPTANMRAGLRIDGGGNSNYIDLYVTTDATTMDIESEYVENGGATNTTTHLTGMSMQSVILQISQFGGNLTGVYYHTDGPTPVIMGIETDFDNWGASNKPSRLGIIYERTASNDALARRASFDWLTSSF